MTLKIINLHIGYSSRMTLYGTLNGYITRYIFKDEYIFNSSCVLTMISDF